MLEETLIRENSVKKLQKRNIAGSVMVGPPVTLVNPVDRNSDSKVNGQTQEEEKSEEGSSIFDTLRSPKAESTNSSENKSPKSAKLKNQNMVPREQYDALKAKFIENETSVKKRLETVDDLESQLKRREDQMIEMESVFSKKLEEL